jgi:hypothetical protein
MVGHLQETCGLILHPRRRDQEEIMVFIIGFVFGIFTGAMFANKNFRNRVITEIKKLKKKEAK